VPLLSQRAARAGRAALVLVVELGADFTPTPTVRWDPYPVDVLSPGGFTLEARDVAGGQWIVVPLPCVEPWTDDETGEFHARACPGVHADVPLGRWLDFPAGARVELCVRAYNDAGGSSCSTSLFLDWPLTCSSSPGPWTLTCR